MIKSTLDSADEAAQAAEQAIHATRRRAGQTLDRASDGVAGIREDIADVREESRSAIDGIAADAKDLAGRSMKSAREASERLRGTAVRASDDMVKYIQGEPVKAVLIASAAGAALVAVASLLMPSRHR